MTGGTARERPGLAELFNPTSIAIVGLSSRSDTYAHRVLVNLRRGRFRGPVLGVHPRAAPVDNIAVYRTVGELPAAPDVGVVCTPSDSVNPLLEDLGRIGCRAAIVLGSGFETDLGARLAADMRALAERYGMAVVGPNCLGVISLVHGAWITGGSPLDDLPLGHVAVVSQSGSGILMMTGCGRLSFSHLVSSGNETVTTLADYLAYFARDPATRVIGAVIESVSDAGRLLAAAESAQAAGKPIVVLKVGRTAGGAQGVRSHTGALAGDPQAFEAFCRRAGIVVVSDYDALIESLAALAAGQAKPAGARVAFVGLSGGEAALIADLAERAGIRLAELSDAGRRHLRALLPGFATVSNPLDGTGALVRDPERFREVVGVLARDAGVDLTAVFLDACPRMSRDLAQTYARLLAHLPAIHREANKPMIVLSNYGGGLSEIIAHSLDGSPIPIVLGTAPGLAAIAACVAAGGSRDGACDRGRQRDPDVPLPLPADSLRLLQTESEAGTEASSAEALDAVGRAYSFNLPERLRARSADEAIAAARRLGYPVVIKTGAPGVAHKSDVGGVILGLRSDEDVRTAFRQIVESVSQHMATASGVAAASDVVVEEMVHGGVEAFIGARTDPVFGPMLGVGLGGALVELLGDVAWVLLPASRADLEDAIARTRLHRLCAGFRGQQPADVDAFIALARRAGALLRDLNDPGIELDLNPVALLPRGQGVRVLDLRITRRPRPERRQ